ncbi:MAG: YkgJ family cysteine cluster protein [Pseudomonadota bacterium]
MSTDIISEACKELHVSIYSTVPDVGCRACGGCCVTPHMTMIEFCASMNFLQDKPGLFQETISRLVPSHGSFPGQLMCRFQLPDQLCSIHPSRPLACRLHGHPVLKAMHNQYDVHCDTTKPAADLTPDDVYGLLDRINVINARFYPHYQTPYWICGLTAEAWLSIVVTDMQQPAFRLLKQIISRACNLKDVSDVFCQTVPIKEKVTLIDAFHALSTSEHVQAIGLLEEIRDGFPETGAYYYFEADEYLRHIKKK